MGVRAWWRITAEEKHVGLISLLEGVELLEWIRWLGSPQRERQDRRVTDRNAKYTTSKVGGGGTSQEGTEKRWSEVLGEVGMTALGRPTGRAFLEVVNRQQYQLLQQTWIR